jgi:hypothetical protein
MTLVKSLYSGDPDLIMICMTVGAIWVKVVSPSNINNVIDVYLPLYLPMASLFTKPLHPIFFRASGGEGGWTTCLPWLSGELSAASVPGAATSLNKRITLNVGGERHEARIHLLPHALFSTIFSNFSFLSDSFFSVFINIIYQVIALPPLNFIFNSCLHFFLSSFQPSCLTYLLPFSFLLLFFPFLSSYFNLFPSFTVKKVHF